MLASTLVNKDCIIMKKTQSELAFIVAKPIKLQQLTVDFNIAENEPVLFEGVMYHGGDGSVTSIDKYVRLNRLAGETNHTIWGADKTDNVFTDIQVDQLMLTIGAKASANKFALKNRQLALESATTIEEVEAI